MEHMVTYLLIFLNIFFVGTSRCRQIFMSESLNPSFAASVLQTRKLLIKFLLAEQKLTKQQLSILFVKCKLHNINILFFELWLYKKIITDTCNLAEYFVGYSACGLAFGRITATARSGVILLK